MIQIAVCDDEREFCERLTQSLRRLVPTAAVHAYCSGEELLSAGVQPDLLFLDIKLPGRDGMETARELRKKTAPPFWSSSPSLRNTYSRPLTWRRSITL